MTIKMRTNAAGPNIKPMLAGKQYEVAPELGAELVKANYAERVGGPTGPAQASKDRR